MQNALRKCLWIRAECAARLFVLFRPIVSLYFWISLNSLRPLWLGKILGDRDREILSMLKAVFTCRCLNNELFAQSRSASRVSEDPPYKLADCIRSNRTSVQCQWHDSLICCRKPWAKHSITGFNERFSSKTGECKISCCWCLKIDFLQTTFKENVPECARVTRFSCLVSTISTIVFCLNSLRPQWLQWALAKISECHVTGKNVWDWTLFSSAIVSIMNSSTGRNFKFSS